MKNIKITTMSGKLVAMVLLSASLSHAQTTVFSYSFADGLNAPQQIGTSATSFSTTIIQGGIGSAGANFGNIENGGWSGTSNVTGYTGTTNNSISSLLIASTNDTIDRDGTEGLYENYIGYRVDFIGGAVDLGSFLLYDIDGTAEQTEFGSSFATNGGSVVLPNYIIDTSASSGLVLDTNVATDWGLGINGASVAVVDSTSPGDVTADDTFHQAVFDYSNAGPVDTLYFVWGIEGAAQPAGNAGAQRSWVTGFEVAEAIPEPSSVVLLCLGGLALFTRRKR